jgi:dGTPase
MSVITIRESLEKWEEEYLHPKAARSSRSKGREIPEDPCPIRTAFLRDRDRIIHSKSFRRLKHKSQVFVAALGDHYRTRLTHTLEVSQIARTISRALRLNEDLTEAISLAHDLGHTPFGHAGEDVLNELMPGGFSHSEQSLRVVERLEKDGKGLNLTWEVRNGILNHSKGMKPLREIEKEPMPATLEAQVMRISDIIAYINHDIDDAIRAGLIIQDDLPRKVLERLGQTHSKRIDTIVKNVIETSLANDLEAITVSSEITGAMDTLRIFLNERVYHSAGNARETEKAKRIVETLFRYFTENPSQIDSYFSFTTDDPLVRRTADLIAGMTDRYAIELFKKLFIPLTAME